MNVVKGIKEHRLASAGRKLLGSSRFKWKREDFKAKMKVPDQLFKRRVCRPLR